MASGTRSQTLMSSHRTLNGEDSTQSRLSICWIHVHSGHCGTTSRASFQSEYARTHLLLASWVKCWILLSVTITWALSLEQGVDNVIMIDTIVYRRAYVTVLDWWEQFWPWVNGLCRLLPRLCYKEIVKVFSCIYGSTSVTASVTSHWSLVLGVHFLASLESNLCTAITRQHAAESIINWHAQDTTALQLYVVLPRCVSHWSETSNDLTSSSAITTAKVKPISLVRCSTFTHLNCIHVWLEPV
jgi:hypothetical protein